MNERKPTEDQKAEALVRMELLNLSRVPIIAKTFREEGAIWTAADPEGTLMKGNPYTLRAIEQFRETAPESLPFYAIEGHDSLSNGEAFRFTALFYVSGYPEEWEADRRDVMNCRPYVYVYNHETPEFSDYGTIGIREHEHAGGAFRRFF